MSTQRVLIGKFADNVNFGLIIALPGFDVLSDDMSDPGKCSFNSNWVDLVKTHQIGLATCPRNAPQQVTVAFPNLGYKPFVETRLLSGSLIYDDLYSTTRSGIPVVIGPDNLVFQYVADPVTGVGPYTVLYIVYKVPAPTG